MSRVHVGKLDPVFSERDLEDKFRIFGVLRGVWVEFDDLRDAIDAIRELDVAIAHRAENHTGAAASHLVVVAAIAEIRVAASPCANQEYQTTSVDSIYNTVNQIQQLTKEIYAMFFS